MGDFLGQDAISQFKHVLGDCTTTECLSDAASCMTVVTFWRQKVIVRQGDVAGEFLWILRNGSLSACKEEAQAPCPPKGSCQSQTARNNQQQGSNRFFAHLCGPGHVVGMSSAVLRKPEPVTVRVESASCEMYRVSWAEAQEHLSKIAIEKANHHALSLHERRYSGDSSVLAGAATVDKLTMSNKADSAPSRCSEWEAFFDAAACHDLLCRKGQSTLWDASRAARGLDQRQGVFSSADRNLRIVTNLGETKRSALKHRLLPSQEPVVPKAVYERDVVDALVRLERGCACGVQNRGHNTCVVPAATAPAPITTGVADDRASFHIVTGSSCSGPPRQQRSQAPPDTSDERLRAEILLILSDDNVPCVQQLYNKAMRNRHKDDMSAWVQELLLDPRLSMCTHTQKLRLLLRRHRQRLAARFSPSARRPATARESSAVSRGALASGQFPQLGQRPRSRP
eukprot:TRINITY_DN24944_c0_g1_i1.p1 TRINITY_DN24944_c0_g1~~TRINITY_DN24944_c0_g1_i1.p1  ORF type:complete len:463 (+),score=46.03 TRINITY_DN24944_c0_g1_i1:27-1391(+)